MTANSMGCATCKQQSLAAPCCYSCSATVAIAATVLYLAKAPAGWGRCQCTMATHLGLLCALTAIMVPALNPQYKNN